MTVSIDKLSNGYMVTYYNHEDYKAVREAFIKLSETMARVKELLEEGEGY